MKPKKNLINWTTYYRNPSNATPNGAAFFYPLSLHHISDIFSIRSVFPSFSPFSLVGVLACINLVSSFLTLFSLFIQAQVLPCINLYFFLSPPKLTIFIQAISRVACIKIYLFLTALYKKVLLFLAHVRKKSYLCSHKRKGKRLWLLRLLN